MKHLVFTSLLTVLSISLVLPNKLMAQNTVEKDTLANWANLTTPPSYPGGLKALDIFLRNTVKYPKQATENNTQGTVQVSFIIEKDGSIGNFRIDRGKEDGLVLHTRTNNIR